MSTSAQRFFGDVMSSSLQRNYLLWMLFLLLALNVVLFSYFNALPYVKSDGWRFIDIYLIPWEEGTLGLSGFFQDHHPAPLVASLFIVNAELFGLRMDYEAMFGVLFIVLTAFVLVREMKKGAVDRLSIIAVALISMSLVSVNIYTWSLVTIAYIPGLFGLLVVIYINRIAGRKIETRDLFILTGWLILFLLIFGDVAKTILVPIVAVYVFSAIIEKKVDYLKIIAVIIVAVLLNSEALDVLGVHGSYAETMIQGDLSGRIVDNFDNFLIYIGIGLMSSWVNLASFSKYFELSAHAVEVAGLVVLAIYFVTCVFYYQSKIYEKTKMPIILIGVGLLAAVSGWVFRYNPELQQPIAANVPRYYMLYSFSLVGVVWVWAEYIKKRTAARLFGWAFVIVLICSHTAAMFNGWSTSKYIRKGIVNVSEIMLAHGNEDFSKALPKYVTGNNYPEPYKKGIKYLKDNKLNVFSEDDLLEKYRK
ncbi:MAG: hypothetical protein OEZ38_09795 [Gammaproteobacteria bacterium]|nr:hypothetical protein [Gammaproteobacteria bacterium]